MGLPVSAFDTIMNCAMQIEREQVRNAESHQRTADRQGYADGFKPKTIHALTFPPFLDPSGMLGF